jgi:hypothetical protein
MEQQDSSEVVDVENRMGDKCLNCQQSLLFQTHKNQLCKSCREMFIKYPIPNWIKIFGIAILALVIYCLLSFPKNLQTGLQYKRGVEAFNKMNHVTAQNKFAEVLKKQPGFQKAQCYFILAAFYNLDLPSIVSTLQRLEGKKIEDEALYIDVSEIISKLDNYVPSDSFNVLLEKYGVIDSIPENEIKDFLSNHGDAYASTTFAGFLYDLKNFSYADSLLDLAFSYDAIYLPALMLKVPLKRDMSQIDSSHYYINKLLSINNESIYAFSSKVRTLLKEKKDADALKLAKECYSKNSSDHHVLASLALAYHYNNDFPNRDKLLSNAKKDSVMNSSFSFVNDIISGKEKFRN